MTTAIAVWSALLEPGKKTKITPQADIRVTTAALGDKLEDYDSRTSVKLTYLAPVAPETEDDDEDEDEDLQQSSTILCSLTPGRIEQASLDIVFSEENEIELEVVGKNPIYLSGNYIMQGPDEPDSEDYGSDFDEEEVDLLDVSSDVEMDPAELDIPSDDEDDSHRFEEIKDEKSAGSKRPRRSSDPIDFDAEVDGEGPAKLNKKAQKLLNKKMKAENGKAVPAGEAPKANGEAKKEGKKEEKEKKDKSEKKDKKDKKEHSESPAKDMKELPSGLQLKDIKVGSGKTAKRGDTVEMRYIGKFTDGKVFDSNTKGKPFSFKVGTGEVIKGWDEGIAGMQVGGERLLIVPPKLGYGNRKIDGIPAGSTLRFECKLVGIL